MSEKVAFLRRRPRRALSESGTRERLLAAAAELLSVIGFERLTTNAIVARAGLTPPAFYTHFEDKYAIIEELAYDLLNRQDRAYATWLINFGTWAALDDTAGFLEGWYKIAAEIAQDVPHALWIMRSLRAIPKLAQVRLEAQRRMTDRLFAFYTRKYPAVDPELLWARLRIRVEVGWVVDELALEEDRLLKEVLFAEAAGLLGASADAPVSPGA